MSLFLYAWRSCRKCMCSRVPVWVSLLCPGLAVIGVVKVNVDGLERNEQARGAGMRPRTPDEDPPGGAPRRQSRDLRDPRRLE